jgi:hypothetical protein
MAYTFNGIGTTFYGSADRRADGSYVTTEWFVLFYLPVIPIRSVRVVKEEKGSSVYVVVFSHNETKLLLQPAPFHWRQVLRTFLGVYGTIIIAVKFSVYLALAFITVMIAVNLISFGMRARAFSDAWKRSHGKRWKIALAIDLVAFAAFILLYLNNTLRMHIFD